MRLLLLMISLGKAFGVIMWLNVFIFLVYKIFTEAFLSTLEQWCWKYFGARVKFYLGPICSSELIWVGGTMLVAADSHLGLNDASLALLDCSWPHKPAPFVQRRAQQPILVINSHKLYSTEQSHNNITFYMLDFPLQPFELILFGLPKTNLITSSCIEYQLWLQGICLGFPLLL